MSRCHPVILDMLAAGQTHLSALAKISPHLTAENASRLLADIRGKTKREVERLAASFETAQPKRDVVVFLPPAAPTAPPQDGGQLSLDSSSSAENPLATNTKPASPPPEKPQAASPPPLAAPSAVEPEVRLVRIAFTASEVLLGKLELARGLLRHKHPEGRLEAVIEEALDLFLARREPCKRPASRSSMLSSAKSAERRSRLIPKSVREEVWRRDGGRCAFVGSEGRRCEGTEWLEFDHKVPFALGGRSGDAENIRLLCRAHNQYAAQQLGLGRPDGR
jgi:5-methylcytosine-specific restriction endonuclease McrA